MFKFKQALVLCLGLFTASQAQADAFFSEGDFDPGTWSLQTPFFGHPSNGATSGVVTDRFLSGNPENGFMLSQFTVNFPGGFNVVHAPVMMDEFVYDPSTEGQITSIAASVKTLAAFNNISAGYAPMRIYLLQEDKIYSAFNPGWGVDLNDPEGIHNFSGYDATDFVELVPNVGTELDSHPDFSGSEIRFGFGFQLTSTFLADGNDHLLGGAFDDVSIRFSTIPEPASAVLLGLGSLAALGNRRARS